MNNTTNENFGFSNLLNPFHLSKGRVNRRGFAFSYVVLMFLGLICGGIVNLFDNPESNSILMVVTGLIALYLFILYYLCPHIRRFHDLGQSGWLAIFSLVPVINFIVFLILLFSKGDAGKNKYGYPVKKSANVIDVLLNRAFIYNNTNNNDYKMMNEEKDNNSVFIAIGIFIAIIIISMSYFLVLPLLRGSDNDSEESTLTPSTTEINIQKEENVKIETPITKEDTKINNIVANPGPRVNTVKVQRIYNAYGDFYSLSIPTGNSSTCVWNYTGGSGAIPYSETTQATAMEKHNLQFWGGTYDYQVNCFDDFGTQYKGLFPTQ